MRATEYYEKYWSADGFCPRGESDESSALIGLLRQHVVTGLRCLDVGCGDGHSAGQWLIAHGCRYIGVDVSENALHLARQRGLVAALMRDASELPFADRSFDVVVCAEVFEHLFRPDLAAAEIARVMRPEGILIATVPNVGYWRRRLDLALFGRWNPFGDDHSLTEPWRDPHIRFFNPTAFRAMLHRAGFQHVSITGHDGAFLRDLPFVGRALSRVQPSPPYKVLERISPALFSHRLGAICRLGRTHAL